MENKDTSRRSNIFLWSHVFYFVEFIWPQKITMCAKPHNPHFKQTMEILWYDKCINASHTYWVWHFSSLWQSLFSQGLRWPAALRLLKLRPARKSRAHTKGCYENYFIYFVWMQVLHWLAFFVSSGLTKNAKFSFLIIFL